MGRVEPVTWLGNVTLFCSQTQQDTWIPGGTGWCGAGGGGGGGGLQIHPDEFGLKNQVSQGASGGGALSEGTKKQKLLSLPVSP